MKKTLTILIALSVLSCSKGKKDKVDPEKAPKPMEMAPAMAVKTPPPVVKKAQTPCEKALNTLNKCLVKPPLSAKISLRLVAQCEHMAKGENALYKKDVQCLAAADGDCGKVEICLSPKTKPVCEIFADTRIKCRRRELKDSLKADFKAFLSEECKLGYKAGDKELMAIYECFKSAREVCVNSRPCFRKLVELDKKRDKQTIMTLEEKFKKINKKTKALYDTCVQYHGACVKELASLSSADLKKLTATQCMFDLFSDNAETKRKMLCLGKTPAPAKGPFPCAAVDTCLKTKK